MAPRTGSHGWSKPMRQREADDRHEGRVTKLVFYHASGESPLVVEHNAGLEDVAALLERVGARGIPVEVLDTSGWDARKLEEAYGLAVLPAVVRHSRDYSVRRVFGTRRRGGVFFGRGVPALLVFREGNRFPADVYPHDDRGRPVTIRDFLQELLAQEGEEREAAGFTLETVERFRRLRRRLTGGRKLPDDSVEIIRAAREGR